MRFSSLFLLLAASLHAQTGTVTGTFVGTPQDYYAAKGNMAGDTNASALVGTTAMGGKFASGESSGTTTLNRNDGNGTVTITGRVTGFDNDDSIPVTSHALGEYIISALDLSNSANTSIDITTLNTATYAYGWNNYSNVPAGWQGKGGVTDTSVSTATWKSNVPIAINGWVFIFPFRNQGAHDVTLIGSPDGGAHWMNPYSYYHQPVSAITCSGGTVTLTTAAAVGDVTPFTVAGGDVLWIHGLTNTAANGKWTSTSATGTSVTFSVGSSCTGITNGSEGGYASIMGFAGATAQGDPPICHASSYSGVCGDGTTTAVALLASTYSSMMWSAPTVMMFPSFIYTGPDNMTLPWGNYQYGISANLNTGANYAFCVPNAIDSLFDSSQYKWYTNQNNSPANIGAGSGNCGSANWTSTQSAATPIWGGPTNNSFAPSLTNLGNVYSSPMYACNGTICQIIAISDNGATSGYAPWVFISSPTPGGPWLRNSTITATQLNPANTGQGFIGLMPWTTQVLSDRNLHLRVVAQWDNYQWGNSGGTIYTPVSAAVSSGAVTILTIATLAGGWQGSVGVKVSGETASCWTAINGNPISATYIDSTHIYVAADTHLCTPGGSTGSVGVTGYSAVGISACCGTQYFGMMDVVYTGNPMGTQLTGNTPTRFQMSNAPNTASRRGLQYWFDFAESKQNASLVVTSASNVVSSGSNTNFTVSGGGTFNLPGTFLVNVSGETATCWTAINGQWSATWPDTSHIQIPVNTSGCTAGASTGYVSIQWVNANPTYVPLATYDQAKLQHNYAVYTQSSGTLACSTVSGYGQVVITLSGMANSLPTSGGTFITVSGLSTANAAGNGTFVTSNNTSFTDSTHIRYFTLDANCSGYTAQSESATVTVLTSPAAGAPIQPFSGTALVACWGFMGAVCSTAYGANGNSGLASWVPAGIDYVGSGGYSFAQPGGFLLRDLTSNGNSGNVVNSTTFAGDNAWTFTIVANLNTVTNGNWLLAAGGAENFHIGPFQYFNIAQLSTGKTLISWSCNGFAAPSNSYSGWYAQTTGTPLAASTPFALTITKSPGTPATGTSGNTHVYVNGTEVAMGSVVSSMANGNYSLSGSPYTQCLQQGALNLGNLAAINSVQNGIYGIYSHFSLYNRVLSSGEVSRLYSYLKTQMSWRGVSLP